VRTGYGASEEHHPQPGLRPHAVCNNLIDAAVWLLGHPAV
jgi:hypothetical protein